MGASAGTTMAFISLPSGPASTPRTSQGRQTPDVQGLGYGVRSRRPSSPVRLYPLPQA